MVVQVQRERGFTEDGVGPLSGPDPRICAGDAELDRANGDASEDRIACLIRQAERQYQSLSEILNLLIDERGDWIDLPPCRKDEPPTGDREPRKCAACSNEFIPQTGFGLDQEAVDTDFDYGWIWVPGKRIGLDGFRMFAVCSKECEHALGRVLELRRHYITRELQTVRKAENLLKETKKSIRRQSNGERPR